MAAPKLHHVGIVQASEADALSLMALLGLEEDFRGYVETWSALCIFTKPLGASPIEFVIPNGGPLERFNKGAGGLHPHVAPSKVNDLEALSAHRFAANDMPLLESRAGKRRG